MGFPHTPSGNTIALSPSNPIVASNVCVATHTNFQGFEKKKKSPDKNNFSDDLQFLLIYGIIISSGCNAPTSN